MRKQLGTVSHFLIIAFVLVQTPLLPPAYGSVAPVTINDIGNGYPAMGIERVLGKVEIQEEGDLYVVRNAEDPSFLEVIERLPSGGWGRILRYRGESEEGRRVDLEFVYQDKENRLTLLDYVSGRFFRTTFTGKRENPSSVLPSKDEKGFFGDLAAYQASSLKWILAPRPFRGWTLPEIDWFYSPGRGLSQEDVWSKRHTRGPPRGGTIL